MDDESADESLTSAKRALIKQEKFVRLVEKLVELREDSLQNPETYRDQVQNIVLNLQRSYDLIPSSGRTRITSDDPKAQRFIEWFLDYLEKVYKQRNALLDTISEVGEKYFERIEKTAAPSLREKKKKRLLRILSNAVDEQESEDGQRILRRVYPGWSDESVDWNARRALDDDEGRQRSNISDLGLGELLKTKRKRSPFDANAKKVLSLWFESHIDYPYPTKGDKLALAEKTGLTIAQINQWFTNERRRNKAFIELYGPGKKSKRRIQALRKELLARIQRELDEVDE